MNHVILAKFKSDYTKEEIKTMFEEIKLIFNNAKDIQGIEGVTYHLNCIDRPNRYDICINISMEKSALSSWDACESHKKWKDKYSDMLESKCIFDYED